VGLLGRRASVVAAISVGAILVLCTSASGQEGGVFSDLDKELAKIKGKVHTDGTLTVGQQETISVTGLGGKHRLAGYISPPPTASTCFDFDVDGYCFPQPLFRVAGTPTFKSSRKGRARLTFVTPPAYEFINFTDPIQSHPIYLVNGQTVHVEVDTTVKRRVGNSTYSLTGTIAKAIVVVEVPPAA
jgi:hypothetical protein